MTFKKYYFIYVSVAILMLAGCNGTDQNTNTTPPDTASAIVENLSIEQKVNQYAKISLTMDLSVLTEKEKQMIPILIDVADIMDDIFWEQAFGDKKKLLDSLTDPNEIAFVKINYGPWEKLGEDQPFLKNFGKKPIGSNFYPHDIKYLPFIDMKFEDKLSMFTILRRSDDGSLYTIPYKKAFKNQLEKASSLLKKAAALAEDPALKKFLELRADAFLTDDYYASDMAWMDMKNNKIDFVVGPIESEEDRFINTKTAYEAFLLVKDKMESEKIEKYQQYIAELQNNLPLDEKYKKEIHGSSVAMGVYEAIYYSGYANDGGKSISINHPKDGRIIMEKGNKKLMFKNVITAKFDKILVPITNLLIAEDQRKNIKAEAFFKDNLFYEVAEATNLVNTVNGKGPVKEALKDEYNTFNSLKAGVLSLYFITVLSENGKYTDTDLLDNYVTFMGNIFRKVRFGAAFPEGKANMITFYYFQDMGAFTRDAKTGTYSINLEKMKEAIKSLSQLVLTMMGDGDYDKAVKLVEEKGYIRSELQKDLNKIVQAGIAKDIVFDQGKVVLGLK
jgi:hypothetical protein